MQDDLVKRLDKASIGLYNGSKHELCAEARDRITALEAGLEDAIECVEAWAAYADDYFKDKHDLAGDLARLRALLKEWKE